MGDATKRELEIGEHSDPYSCRVAAVAALRAGREVVMTGAGWPSWRKSVRVARDAVFLTEDLLLMALLNRQPEMPKTADPFRWVILPFDRAIMGGAIAPGADNVLWSVPSIGGSAIFPPDELWAGPSSALVGPAIREG